MPLAAATTVLPAKASTEVETCEYHITKLAQAMKAIHGGEWAMKIDHLAKTAMVIKH